MVVHWITSLLGHNRQRRVPTRPASGVAQTRRLPPRRSAEHLLYRWPRAADCQIARVVTPGGRLRTGADPNIDGRVRTTRGSLGSRAQTTAQRPGIMMCADDVPVSMTHEPARV